MDKMKEGIIVGALTAVLLPIGMFLIWLATAPWRGFVFMTLWGWFAVPLGAPPLLLWQAMGICLMAVVSTVRLANTNDEHAETWKKITFPFLAPAIWLLFGWLILVIFK